MHPTTTLLSLLALAAPTLSAPTEQSHALAVVARTPPTGPTEYCKTNSQDTFCCDKKDNFLNNLLGLKIQCALSLGSPCGENANVYCCDAGQTTSTGLISFNLLSGCNVFNLLG